MEQPTDSNPPVKRKPAWQVQNGDHVLDGWLEEIERTMIALQSFQVYLKSWRQHTFRVRPEDVDGVHEMLRHANLTEWAQDGWAELREIVISQTVL